MFQARDKVHGLVALKKRTRKPYRVKELDDELMRQRTRKEARLLVEAKNAGVRVPIVYSVHPSEGVLVTEFFEGKKARDSLSKENAERVCREVGENIAKMHSSGFTHGDLTTSNIFLLSGEKNRVAFIDFGLGKTTNELEEFAVDLLNLKKTLNATHSRLYEAAWKSVLKGYSSVIHSGIESKIEEIEKRARYL